MKNSFNVFLIIFSLFISTSAFAAFTVPAPSGNVVDTSGKLTGDQKAKIQERLTSINNSSKNEIGVLIVPSLEGTEPAAAGLMVFDSWKIGKKGLDNGVLLLVVIDDHKIRVATGKGVEGDLTDLQSNDIIKNDIAPEFKRGNFYQGIMNGVDKIDSTLESRAPKPVVVNPTPVTTTTATTDSSGNGTLYIGASLISAFLMLVGGFVYFIRREEEKERISQAERDSDFVKAERIRREEESDRAERKRVIDQERAESVARAKADSAERIKTNAVVESNCAAETFASTVGKVREVKEAVKIQPSFTVPRPVNTARTVKTNKERAEEQAEQARKESAEKERKARIHREQLEESERLARQRKARQEDDDRRSRRDEEERSSRSSSNDSGFGGFDSGGSSGGGFDFGGGSSGGGGSTGGWTD